MTLLSIVVPCYNEEAVLPAFHQRLTAALTSLPRLDAEVLYVDDGSTDGTAAALRRLHETDPRVKALRLSRNFGHQLAISAGLEYAAGHAVVVIDGDLQDPPELMPQLVAAWREGAQVVYGVRTARAGETHAKLWTAKWFYRLLNRLSEVSIPLDAGDFRLMDRQVVTALLHMPERHRFLRGMVSWTGFRQVSIPYERAARHAGRTKYSVWGMTRLALDALFSFSVIPLRLATWAGCTVSGLALIGVLYALWTRLFTRMWIPGWTLMFIAMMFLGGVQLLALGIIGEYVGRLYGESKQRPLYIVSEQFGFTSPSPLDVPVHEPVHFGSDSTHPG